MGKNRLKKFPKRFKTRKKVVYIRGRLFKEITIWVPVFSNGKPVALFENSPKYELNIPRFNELITLLEKRNLFVEKYESIPDSTKKIPLSKSDLKKRGLPENTNAYYSVRTPESEKAYENYKLKKNLYFNQLKNNFEYYKLIHFHDPDEPDSKWGYPFFDLRYLLRQEDLRKWATVIRLELEYHRFNVSKRGKQVKEIAYPREMLVTYELYLAYARKNYKSPEIDATPHHWAVKKTQAVFPDVKIDGNRLREFVKKWRRQIKK